jgi:hypothetical protein
MSAKSDRKKAVKAQKQEKVATRVKGMGELAADGDYQALAVAAAEFGAEYLEAEIKSGVSSEDATFMPQAFIIGKDGKVSITLLAVDDVKKAVEYASKTATVALTHAGWISKAAVQDPTTRPSQQADRQTVSTGSVWVNGAMVAGTAIPIGAAA